MRSPVVCDTHALLYWALAPKRLSARAKREIERARERGELVCADISLWEIAMLADRGRLKLPVDTKRFLDELQTALGLKVMPVNAEIASLSQRGFPANTDPADQLIGATAIHLKGLLLTRDVKLGENKNLKTLW